jgi:hypothetical protein
MTVQLEFLESDLRAKSGTSPGRRLRGRVMLIPSAVY